MKVGDLVALKLCQQAGKIGMITCIPKQSHLGQRKPLLRLYWVLLDAGVQCFTGNQLITHKWMENESR
jgi:hypothetical protein